MFLTILRIRICYILKQHEFTGLRYGEEVCFLEVGTAYLNII
jgi:hypothetical protein